MNFKIISLIVAISFWALFPVATHAQKTNYDESKVPSYTLPDPLVFNNGKQVKNERQWQKKRRKEIIEIFAQEMYGHVPAKTKGIHFNVVSEKTVYNGLAIRKVVRIFLDSSDKHWFDVLIHLPAAPNGPVPVFVGLNFQGNDATLDDRASRRWPYEQIVKAGYGVATAWRDSVEPDGKETKIYQAENVCRDGGIRAWYNQGGDWGAISAWSWGLSRIMDYLETDPVVDVSKVTVIGHSRLGKAALWAGANDIRFAMVISNNSGCCGAAISRRVFGESFRTIIKNYPHWFTKEFYKYTNKEAEFPADQHWLAALAAPRPLYITSATKDRWADPKGEWLTAWHVSPVYALFGFKGVGNEMPKPNTPDQQGRVGYHLRSGKHDIISYDWGQFIRFADRHYYKK
ncbi:MAG: acetylxylan esterase [Rikenellaceae bacterium]|nr:acetylxylan esterase [Rikenellaceae bacterium]